MHWVKSATLETANLVFLTSVRPKPPFWFRPDTETKAENWQLLLADGGKFRFRQKKIWPWNRYQMVLFGNTKTSFHSYTTLDPVKVQLISKCPCCVIVLVKIPTKNFDNFCPRIWKVVKSTKLRHFLIILEFTYGYIGCLRY